MSGCHDCGNRPAGPMIPPRGGYDLAALGSLAVAALAGAADVRH